MTTISAQVIKDSVSPQNVCITTFQLRYPRSIHSEFMTHRQFSRNASSSRAIPTPKLIQDVIDDPAIPLYWGRNQKGMQATEECDQLVLLGKNTTEVDKYGPYADREAAWLYARDQAVQMAENFYQAGYHKQLVNRILEPFAHINVVVTSTQWANFFGLRRHPDAEPHIRILADRMWEAMKLSEPLPVGVGEWHIPYVEEEDQKSFQFTDGYMWDLAVKVSVARCARVSYLTRDGRRSTVEEDLTLYERLVGSQPIHASPAEHQATPDEFDAEKTGQHSRAIYGWKRKTMHGNFNGWVQYRKMLPDECITQMPDNQE